MKKIFFTFFVLSLLIPLGSAQQTSIADFISYESTHALPDYLISNLHTSDTGYCFQYSEYTWTNFHVQCFDESHSLLVNHTEVRNSDSSNYLQVEGMIDSQAIISQQVEELGNQQIYLLTSNSKTALIEESLLPRIIGWNLKVIDQKIYYPHLVFQNEGDSFAYEFRLHIYSSSGLREVEYVKAISLDTTITPIVFEPRVKTDRIELGYHQNLMEHRFSYYASNSTLLRDESFDIQDIPTFLGYAGHFATKEENYYVFRSFDSEVLDIWSSKEQYVNWESEDLVDKEIIINQRDRSVVGSQLLSTDFLFTFTFDPTAPFPDQSNMEINGVYQFSPNAENTTELVYQVSDGFPLTAELASDRGYVQWLQTTDTDLVFSLDVLNFDQAGFAAANSHQSSDNSSNGDAAPFPAILFAPILLAPIISRQRKQHS